MSTDELQGTGQTGTPMPPRASTPQKKQAATRLVVMLLGTAAFIVTADARVVTPLLPIIAGEFKTNIGVAGVIVTAYALPYGLFQLLYGPLGDRIGKLRVMTGAMAVFAVGTAACALVPSLLLLDLLRFLTGAAAAAMIPLSLAYIGDTFPYEERQIAIAHYLTAIALGQILSTSMGGIVGDYLNWRYIFLGYGLLSVIVVILFWRLTRRMPHAPALEVQHIGLLASLKPYAQLLSHPAPRLVIIAVFIEGIFFYGEFTYLGAFLKDRYHLPYIAIGLMLSGFGLGNLIYSRSVRWLVRRLGERGMIIVGGALTCACYLAIALFNSWFVFVLINIVFGVSFYMIHNTLQTRATELAPEARGTAVSLFAFSLFLGQGIGAALLGMLINASGYTPSLLVAGVPMVLLAVWFVWRMQRTA